MKHLFGPVKSRRLGNSLGIDLLPYKTCSMNCIYCECGTTNNLTNKRELFTPVEGIMEELDHFFQSNPHPDFITYSGSGEPLLYSRIGELSNKIKEKYPNIKLALLTNSILLNDKKVREELSVLDVILPSLDAVLPTSFKKINLPVHEIKIEDVINGLIELRQSFNKEIWLEIFIVPGINDSPKELDKFKKIIPLINPNLIQLNSLDRKGTQENLTKAPHSKLESIKELWGFDNIEIISRDSEKKEEAITVAELEKGIIIHTEKKGLNIKEITNKMGLPKMTINSTLKVMIKKNLISTKQEGQETIFLSKR